MRFLRRHPLFTAIIAVIAVVIAVEAWYAHVFRAEAAAARKEVDQRIADIERYQRQKPAPTDQNLRAARDDFAQNAEVLATMLRVLNVTGPDDLAFFQGEPATRPDAWFEISQFVDRMTGEARKNNVSLPPDTRFGFSTYAFEGPEAPFIRSVYRQHRIIEYLLGKLFAARPTALIAVQREQPEAVAANGAPTPAASPAAARGNPPGTTGSADSGEIFAIDPQVSARTPGYVDTMAFRIVFAGQTTSLRGFMNALAAPDIPLVVRSVEVVEGAAKTDRPAASQTPGRPRNPFGGEPAPDTAQPINNAAVPIVPENASVFTVTVELFEVKIRAPQTAMTASTP